MGISLAAAEAEVTFHAHPDVWALMAFLVVGYMAAVACLGPRLAAEGEEPASTRQKLWFFGGVAFLYIGSEWPIHDIAEDYLFSIHMVQHTLYTLVAPGMILLGMPRWLLRWMFRPVALQRLLRVLTRPLIALAVFNIVIAVTHWPAIVNASVASEPFHFAVHVVLVSSALLMWWPVVDPLPEMKRLSDPGKMLYLFGQSILPTVPASFLTFATGVVYSSYAEFPRLWGMSVTNDQMVAGLLMKIGGGLLLWTVIAVIFFRWHGREERNETQALSWDDFEHELRAWDLRRT